MSAPVVVPGWLAALPKHEAREVCAYYARSCVAEATVARCGGYDTGAWYRAARVWLDLRSAL